MLKHIADGMVFVLLGSTLCSRAMPFATFSHLSAFAVCLCLKKMPVIGHIIKISSSSNINCCGFYSQPYRISVLRNITKQFCQAACRIQTVVVVGKSSLISAFFTITFWKKNKFKNFITILNFTEIGAFCKSYSLAGSTFFITCHRRYK